MTNINKTSKGYDIELTRGDTLLLTIAPTVDGEIYVGEDGDVIRFAMKRKHSIGAPALVKNIPLDTMQLCLEKEETARLAVGEYDYDIEYTGLDGYRETFIEGSIRIMKDVC